MRPVGPMLFLEANEDTELAGIEIPRGTPVFLLTRPAPSMTTIIAMPRHSTRSDGSVAARRARS